MSSPMFKGLGKRTALIGAIAAVLTGFAASSAFASVNLSPEGPYSPSTTTPVVVSGEAPAPIAAETTHVASVVCNATGAKAPLGSHCDLGSASSATPSPIGDYEEELVEVNVRRGAWDDWSFLSGAPAQDPAKTQTTCLNTSSAGEACSVVVSYYKQTGPFSYKFLGQESQSILFQP